MVACCADIQELLVNLTTCIVKDNVISSSMDHSCTDTMFQYHVTTCATYSWYCNIVSVQLWSIELEMMISFTTHVVNLINSSWISAQHATISLALPWLGKIEWSGCSPVSLPRHATISPALPWLTMTSDHDNLTMTSDHDNLTTTLDHDNLTTTSDHDMAWLGKIEWPCCGPYHSMLLLAQHHHDLAKLNDLVVVLYPYHDSVEMFLCKHYLIGCPSHLIIIKVALGPCHDLGQTVSCKQFEH